MPYTVRHHPDSGLIETHWTGVVTATDLRASTSECIALQKQTGITRFVVDITQVEPSASPVDLFALPDKQYREESLDSASRIAIVAPLNPKARNNATFYETACRNRGWNVQTFEDRAGALAWLAGSA
jgi:hypothetical protein